MVPFHKPTNLVFVYLPPNNLLRYIFDNLTSGRDTSIGQLVDLLNQAFFLRCGKVAYLFIKEDLPAASDTPLSPRKPTSCDTKGIGGFLIVKDLSVSLLPLQFGKSTGDISCSLHFIVVFVGNSGVEKP
jgi:hypothetical protein